MNAYIKIRAALEWGEGPIFVEALAALAELERAAAQPVAYCNGDNLDIGIPLRFQAFTRPQAFADTPLYSAPPAPVSEIREVEVTDEMAERAYISKWRGVPESIDYEPDDEDRQWAREWLSAWRAELGPTLGLAVMREPTQEECNRILRNYQMREDGCWGLCMFRAVRAVMWPKEGGS